MSTPAIAAAARTKRLVNELKTPAYTTSTGDTGFARTVSDLGRTCGCGAPATVGMVIGGVTRLYCHPCS